MKEAKRKDEVKNFYLNKTRTQNTGQRIEKVRVVLEKQINTTIKRKPT